MNVRVRRNARNAYCRGPLECAVRANVPPFFVPRVPLGREGKGRDGVRRTWLAALPFGTYLTYSSR